MAPYLSASVFIIPPRNQANKAQAVRARRWCSVSNRHLATPQPFTVYDQIDHQSNARARVSHQHIRPIIRNLNLRQTMVRFKILIDRQELLPETLMRRSIIVG